MVQQGNVRHGYPEGRLDSKLVKKCSAFSRIDTANGGAELPELNRGSTNPLSLGLVRKQTKPPKIYPTRENPVQLGYI